MAAEEKGAKDVDYEATDDESEDDGDMKVDELMKSSRH